MNLKNINDEHDYFKNGKVGEISHQQLATSAQEDGSEIKQCLSDVCDLVEAQLLVEEPNEVETNKEHNVEVENGTFHNNDFVASLIEVVDNIHNAKPCKQEPILISSSSSKSGSSSDTDYDTDDDDWKPPKANITDFNTEKETVKNKKEKNKLNLPQIENVEVNLPDYAELVAMGKIMSIIDKELVVIKSYPNKPAFNMDTVLFFDRNTAVGMIDETFGPVDNPHYVIRFNDEAHLAEKGVEVGKEVYFALNMEKYTTFIFLSELRKIRGSDASWKNNEEPPPEHIDFSDDEQERNAKKKSKNRKRKPQTEQNNTTAASTTGTQGCTNRSRTDRWHNQQTRFQVPDDFDSLVGWNNAVNMRRNNMYPRMQNNFNPPPIHTLFQTPPPPSPQHMSPGFPIPPAFYQHPPPPDGNFTPFNDPRFAPYLWHNQNQPRFNGHAPPDT